MSHDIREILVATDFSELGGRRVRVAHAYAKAFGARLHVFHVTWPDELGLTKLFAALVAQLGTTVLWWSLRIGGMRQTRSWATPKPTGSTSSSSAPTAAPA